MASCKLDLSRPCFLASLDSLPETPEAKQEALNAFKEKIERDYRSCHRVVQKFWGNAKFTHLHGKIWKYDWGESSAAGRKSWRMVVVVPNPDQEPYELIAAAVYAKNVAEQLSVRELASIFDTATKPIVSTIAAGQNGEKPDFRRVSNGDGKTRSLCSLCYEAVAVTDLVDELDAAEKSHRCDLASEEELKPNELTSESQAVPEDSLSHQRPSLMPIPAAKRRSQP